MIHQIKIMFLKDLDKSVPVKDATLKPQTMSSEILIGLIFLVNLSELFINVAKHYKNKKLINHI
jgi:hypothetical protein